MQFKFKVQDYQTQAVESVADVFTGQPLYSPLQAKLSVNKLDVVEHGFCNQKVELSSEQLLQNIQKVQSLRGIPSSSNLSVYNNFGACMLDVEMETGTGKTYVYIKTMFELNKRYGWTKFIIVVPSVAIREGVKASFNLLSDHFTETYDKTADCFVYDSDYLQSVDRFVRDESLQVMIINSAAFASFQDNGKQASRRIYMHQDNMTNLRPIDLIAFTNPIIIRDEPQKMEGDATLAGLQRFNPLFIINYSATHKTKHNCVYALDAYDAFEQQLVKKIEVCGFELTHQIEGAPYISCEDFILYKNKAPKIRLELDVKYKGGIKREVRILAVGDDLYQVSQNLEQYNKFVIIDINPLADKLSFSNGVTLKRGEVFGECSQEQLQRLQIRETIRAHFDKERTMFTSGIKVLSLFFIDEVAKYKTYDDQGMVRRGILQQIFETEYSSLLADMLHQLESSPLPSDLNYAHYLKQFSVQEVHSGYFSVDKTNRAIDSKYSKRTGLSDDKDAYNLIIKDKQRLLSFEEPVRFIFSHSALREGWDNPNIFQICSLRQTNSIISRRQEVGRGLRICVDQNGERMDKEMLGERFFEVNSLTVIANESYSSFVGALQQDIQESLRERGVKLTPEYLVKQQVQLEDGSWLRISDEIAGFILCYLNTNGYLDDKGYLSGDYMQDMQNNTLEPLPRRLRNLGSGLHVMLQSKSTPNPDFGRQVSDSRNTRVLTQQLNANFSSQSFQKLWSEINHKYLYTVYYDSNELINQALNALNGCQPFEFGVPAQFKVIKGSVMEETLVSTSKHTASLSILDSETVEHDNFAEYDIVGKIATATKLTRRTVVAILKGMRSELFDRFKLAPSTFVQKVTSVILEQKASMLLKHIHYEELEDRYSDSIFVEEHHRIDASKAILASKSVTDYVFTDGSAQDSIEKTFVYALEASENIEVYAKLPKAFKIPTPVGGYTPDWVIVFNQGLDKQIFFVTETKGNINSMQLRGFEKTKISYTEKLFQSLKQGKVHYHVVSSYQDLVDIASSL